MRLFFDTSVLIPVYAGEHEHHASSKAAFLQGSRKDRSCSAHSLAEFYSTLTRPPNRHRVDADKALLFIGNILERLSMVALTGEEYVSFIQTAARDGIVGGTIYDALLARCAIKAQADVIYTWNLKHFQQFPDVRSRVRTP